MELHAQQRGGGGFGGFGGFGGGGFNRGGTAAVPPASQYNNNGTVGSATISVDPVTHNIMVIADKETSEQISKVIASLDAPEPQVLIKVVFMEVDDNKASAIGVQGSYTGAIGQQLFADHRLYDQLHGRQCRFTVPTPTIVPTSITPINQSFNVGNNFGLPQSLAGATGNGGLYQVLGNDFTATHPGHRHRRQGAGACRARPFWRATARWRRLSSARASICPAASAYTAVGNSATTVPTINGTYQNVGIQLDVTPFIGANNLVQMILQPQITSIDTSTPGQVIEGGSLFSSAVYAPNINKRSANTVVVTPDGADRSSSAASFPTTNPPATARCRFWATFRCSASCSSSAPSRTRKPSC